MSGQETICDYVELYSKQNARKIGLCGRCGKHTCEFNPQFQIEKDYKTMTAWGFASKYYR